MRKGVVLKIKKDRAIIMADDCTYCEIKSFYGMYPGMEVCFNEEDMFNKRKLFSVNRYITAACFILLVFCSYLFLSFYQENMAAYAYVGIDINPSIEIALNKKGRIINARGLDEEGKEILEEINVKNMDSMEGVKAIITKSIEMNYLEAENKNQITVYAVLNNKNSGDGKELVEKVERVIKEEVVAHSIDGEIKTIVSDKKVKKEADKKGISVAKYIMENAKGNVVGKKNNNKGKNEIMTMNTDNNKENKNKDKKDNKESNDNKNDENKKTDKRDEVNESIKNKKDKLADDKNNKGNKDKEKEINRHDNVKNKEPGDDKKDKSERKADKDDIDDKDDGEDRKDKKNSEKNRNNEKDKDKEQVKNNKRDKDRDDKKDNKKDGMGDNQKDNKNDDKKDNSRDNNSKVRNDNKDQKMNKSYNKNNNGLINRLLQKIRIWHQY